MNRTASMPSSAPEDFIRRLIRKDLGDNPEQVVTRFPPEPNGYLHLGHSKSICVNFGIAEAFGGRCVLRYDDTDPVGESTEFIEAIREDVDWLGFTPHRVSHAADYFEAMYDFAVELIAHDKAYVCDLSFADMREMRGTLTTRGQPSPFRARHRDENLERFAAMRVGDYAEGACVLRARIDMASPNLNLRDPVLYRIKRMPHPRRGTDWCIYPTYDFAQGYCDALDGVTHSLCTLEFDDHRPLYDWLLANVSLAHRPRQIEFSRLNVEYFLLSKRLLQRLVSEQRVAGWDDPRMPTLRGLRARGVPAEAIRELCERVGVTRQEKLIEMRLFDFCIRGALEKSLRRAMAVIKPLKVTLTNYASDGELLEANWHPQVAELGRRDLPFGAELYMESDDFSEHPPPGFKRLTPGGMVRLRYAYIIRCDEVIKTADGEIRELRCSYFPESRSGSDTSGIKVRGVVHWVSAHKGEPVEIAQLEPLFVHAQASSDSFENGFNDNSRTIRQGFVEPAVLATGDLGFQFERLGYFRRAHGDARQFHTTVALRDSFKSVQPGKP